MEAAQQGETVLEVVLTQETMTKGKGLNPLTLTSHFPLILSWQYRSISDEASCSGSTIYCAFCRPFDQGARVHTVWTVVCGYKVHVLLLLCVVLKFSVGLLLA